MLTGIRYQYHDGGSVDIKYPKQRPGFQEGGTVDYTDYSGPSQGYGEPASNVGLQPSYNDYSNSLSLDSSKVVNPAGTGGGTGGSGNPGDPSNYQQVAQQQTPTAASNTGAGGLIGGIVDNVLGIFGVGQNAASATLNRNLARKSTALGEATTAENLRGAGQNRQQGAIQFGEQQQQYSGQLKMAGAWSKGVAAGLTTART